MNAHVVATETPTPNIVTQIQVALIQSGVDADEAAAIAAGRSFTLTAAQDMANFMQATCQGTTANASYYSLSLAAMSSGITYTPSVKATDSSYGAGSWNRGTPFTATAPTTTAAPTTAAPTTAAPTNQIGNPSFESALYTSAGAPNYAVQNNWHIFIPSGSPTGERLTSSTMTGSYVCHMAAPNAGNAYVDVRQILTKAQIDATTGMLSFDIRPIAVTGKANLYLQVMDGSGADIMNSADDAAVLLLYGTALGAANTNLSFAPAANTTHHISFNLKTTAIANLLAGKTWTDVANIVLVAACQYDATDGAGEFYLDNFSLN